jgi:hypothetical protein
VISVKNCKNIIDKKAYLFDPKVGGHDLIFQILKKRKEDTFYRVQFDIDSILLHIKSLHCIWFTSYVVQSQWKNFKTLNNSVHTLCLFI